MRLVNVIVVLMLIAPAAVAQQAVPTPAARTLRGVVLTASDVPLPRVRVTVTGAPATEPPVLSDERGQFSVRVPDADPVRLTFAKARYAAVTVDVRRSELNAGNTAGMRVRLSLGGAISGQVRDRSGAPVVEVTVTVRQTWPAAQSEPPVLAATSNDLGEFRFGGLVAGVYSIGVRPVPSIINTVGAALAPTGEQSVNVGLGAEVSGLDLTIDVPSELPMRHTERADPATTGSLRGRVITPRGAPVAAAGVQIYGLESGAVTEAVETDARGRYVIDRMVPGEYRVRAFKSGYITPRDGQGRSAIDSLLTSTLEGRVVAVRRGQMTDSTDLILGRGASISGTIVDEFGEPMQDVAVSALELRAMGGQTRALEVAARGALGRTDDHGRYRLYGMQPGTYIVQATLGNVLSATTGYPPTFYPGTPSIELATTTKLAVDEATAGIDLTLSPQPVRRVRGTLVDPAGIAPDRTMVTLTSRTRSGGIQTAPVRGGTNADGTFEFHNVSPGEYVVQATANGRPEPSAKVAVIQQFAEAFVTVTGDEPTPLQLKLTPGATLMGRVVYEGIAELPPPYAALKLTAVPAAFERDPLLAAGSTGFALLSDQTFEYRGVFGRSFLAVQPLNANWYVKSIAYKGQELADAAFDFGYTETFRDVEIIVSGAGAAVTGRVTDERAAPVRDGTVALFSADRSKWTIRSRWLKVGRSTQDGAFKLAGVVPGDYWVVAVDRLEGTEVAGDLQNPDVLDALASRAQRITLGEGQSQSLTLRLVRR